MSANESSEDDLVDPWVDEERLTEMIELGFDEVYKNH